MAKIIIAILVAIVIIDALIVYACCVVAGKADDVAEERKLHDTLRKAYLTELKVDLMILNSLLNEWSYDGCKIERDEDEQIDT